LDGTNRVLVVFTPSQPQPGMDPMGNPTTVEGTPQYGIYMLDLNSKTLRPVVLPQNGFYYASPVPLQARPKPAVIGQFTPDATIPPGLVCSTSIPSTTPTINSAWAMPCWRRASPSRALPANPTSRVS